ncbi:hypothetical protein GCM10020367_06640 [Streptomyces sannanensis]|uniref:F-box domain-containing protein n=1 Tax=Streptomyces sannanensis TaxID=285536 RepID=A0ABP6S5M7_9ACTN
MVTGTPEGSRAPVMVASSAPLDVMRAVLGRMPASDMSRVTSRFWSGRTSVTTLPVPPARAVRPLLCR